MPLLQPEAFIWNNGQSYSDEEVRFLSCCGLSREEVTMFCRLMGRIVNDKKGSYVVGFASQLELIGATVEPIYDLANDSFIFADRADAGDIAALNALVVKAGGKEIQCH